MAEEIGRASLCEECPDPEEAEILHDPSRPSATDREGRKEEREVSVVVPGDEDPWQPRPGERVIWEE